MTLTSRSRPGWVDKAVANAVKKVNKKISENCRSSEAYLLLGLLI